MAEYFLDSNDAGDGSFYVDAAGLYSPPAVAYFLDSIAVGDGSFYIDSNTAAAAGGSFYYFLMMFQ